MRKLKETGGLGRLLTKRGYLFCGGFGVLELPSGLFTQGVGFGRELSKSGVKFH